MNPLVQIIQQEIDARGVIPFARFMALASYCPEFGYYDQFEARLGPKGDFYTSVSVGSLFGQLLAFQFARWLEEIKVANAQLVEAGAHDGRLAADILNWLRSYRPLTLDRLEYWILEPSVRRQQVQQQTLGPFVNRVRWFDGWHRIPDPGISGVIFSNELLDAMPVHRLGWDATNRSWFEWGVGGREGRFIWDRLEAPSLPPSHFPRLPSELAAVLPDGFATEVSPAATDWWRQASRALRKGRLLTFDFGLKADEFFRPERAGGTLRAYHRHRLSDDLLGKVGAQDLTAHVNFTAIQGAGEAAGLTTEGLLTQAQFLTRIGEAAWQTPDGLRAGWAQQVRQFQTLTHPEHLGTKFKVLLQSRGQFSAPCDLAGTALPSKRSGPRRQRKRRRSP